MKLCCSICDSDDVIGVDGEYATGVASDGYVERRMWVGYRCLACGNVEEME